MFDVLRRRRAHLPVVLVILSMLLAACAGGEQEAADGDGETQSDTEGTTREETGGPPDGEEAVSLDVYMGFAEPNVVETAEAFFADVAERSDGLITLEVTSSTDSISPFESFDPLVRGVVDFAVSSTVYFTDQVPEPMVDMAIASPEEELRDAGVLDLFNEVLHEHDVHLLGWTGSGNQFMLIGNAKIDGADFSGLNIRTFPAINSFITQLGGSPVAIPGPERYSALERGVVDLVIAPIPSVEAEKLYEVSEYAIYPPFLQVREVLLLNKGAWDGLSDWKKQILEEAVIEHEKFARQQREEDSVAALEKIRENTEAVELSESEAQKLRQAAFDSTLDFMAEQSSNPEIVEQIREALEKLSS